MRNKKGVSSTVSTVLIILLVLVVLGVISAVVFGFIRQGAGQISASKFTVRVGLVSANVDFDTGIATVRVNRDLGAGDLVGLKFIFEDQRSSEVFDVEVAGFDELEEKTFDINLISPDSELQLFDIQKVSVAPIILLESGEEVIGGPSEPVAGLNLGIGELNQTIPDPNETDFCYNNTDCGSDYFVEGTKYCLENSIYQYKKVFTCVLGFCDETLEDTFIETCDYQCYDGECIDDPIQCSPESVSTDCGVSGLIGLPACASGGIHKIVQDYKSYECINGTCDVSITSITIEECNESEVCHNAECFVPLECTKHSDCNVSGEYCVDGECVVEPPVNTGIISSIWPFSIGEYFDSPDLLDPGNMSLVGYFIVFPGSAQTDCLKISEHLMPNATNAAPYVRLNETVTSIAASDNFQVWETDYICSIY